MKIYGGVKVYLSHSWIWHSMEVSGQLHAPATLSLSKSPLVPIAYEAGIYCNMYGGTRDENNGF
jgi:hypothetical protein